MRLLYSAILSFIFIASCDSPMDHRVNSDIKPSIAKLSFATPSLQVEVKWIDGPYGNINKTNHLVVFLYKEGKLYSLPENQTLEFYATMPSMGHPLDDPGVFESIDNGIYVNKSIRYNMPGDWKNELWIMDSDLKILDRLEWLIYF